MGATPSRGEVWWHQPPDQTARPYLVLTRTEAIGYLSRLFAVPATRTIRELPSEVYLDTSDGMPTACVLSLDNAKLVRRAYLTTKITTLSAAKMVEVCEALRFAMAC